MVGAFGEEKGSSLVLNQSLLPLLPSTLSLASVVPASSSEPLGLSTSSSSAASASAAVATAAFNGLGKKRGNPIFDRVEGKTYKHNCNKCDYGTDNRGSLYNHKAVHTGPRHFCVVIGCEKKYTQRASLKKHIKTAHEKVREFACVKPGCEKAFTEALTLNTHVRAVHDKVKDFKCGECGKDFVSNANVRQHQRTVHSRSTDTKCNLCSKTFSDDAGLRRHKRRMHMESTVEPP
jgi:uncharacterized Zn-finger protein